SAVLPVSLTQFYGRAVNTRRMGNLSGGTREGQMTKFGDLAPKAQRCEELAEVCSDRTIALKLRALAEEYRDIAKRSTIVTPVLVMKRCPFCGSSQSTRLSRIPSLS